jgi:hypothetical protein
MTRDHLSGRVLAYHAQDPGLNPNQHTHQKILPTIYVCVCLCAHTRVHACATHTHCIGCVPLESPERHVHMCAFLTEPGCKYPGQGFTMQCS